MSFHFYVYRAAEGLGPINRWDRMHAESLGTVEDVMETLSTLFPSLRWKRSELENGAVFWSALSANLPDDPYLDVNLQVLEGGHVHFVVLNKAAPSVMRTIMVAMKLNHVSAPEADALVDPYAYSDDDRYFARKSQQA